ncbi:MAG: sodium:solute symporter family protein [Oscillospiraceae bacterium]|nr:sodium:solute symporter family protein [Oscillospiraceae bacterium]
MANLSILDLCVILLYILLMFYIGIRSKNKIKNTDDYYLAGRGLGLVILATTVCASIIGGSPLLGRTGVTYRTGMAGMMLAIPYLAGMYIFSLFSGRIHDVGTQYGISSIPDLFAYRFGKGAKLIVAALIAFSMGATVAASVKAFATVITVFFGVSSVVAASWAGVLLIISYTAISGLFGVVYTDLFQCIILVVTMYLLLPILGVAKIGGFRPMFSQVPKELLKINMTPDITNAVFTNLFFTAAGAEMWQRAFAAKDKKTATNGMTLGNTIYAFTILSTLFIAFSALVLYPNIAEMYPAIGSDAVVPVMSINLLPAGLLGLAVAGILSAIMSSADTYLLIAAQTLTADILKPALKITDNKKELLTSRICIIVLGILALVISLYIDGLYNTLMFAWTFYAAAVGFPAFAALYWKKATTAGICSGMISGFIVSLGWKFIGNPGGISESVAGIVVCIVLTVGVSLLTYKKEAPTPFCSVTTK